MDIQSVCRACLGLSGPFLSIFVGDGNSNGTLAEKMKDFIKTRPKAGDNLPEKVCLTCIGEINRCYSFVLKCVNSDRTLRQLIPNAQIVDEEQPKIERKVELMNKSVQTVRLQSNVAGVQTAKTKTVDRSCSPVNLVESSYNGKEDIISLDRITRSKTKGKMSPIKKRCLDQKYKMIEMMENDNEIVLELHSNDDKVKSEDAHQSYTYEPQDNVIDVGIQEQTSGKKDKRQVEYLIKNQKIIYTPHQRQEHDDDFNYEFLNNSKSSEMNFTIYNNDNGEEEVVMANPKGSLIETANKTMKKKRVEMEYKCRICTMLFSNLPTFKKHFAICSQRSDLNTKKKSKGSCQESIDQQLLDGVMEIEVQEQTNNDDISEDGETVLEIKLPQKDSVFDNNVIADENIAERVPQNSVYTCELCHATFVHRKSLNHHLKLGACTIKSYKCDECERIFISAETLTEHKLTHSFENRCQECNLNFETVAELNKHLIDVHNRKSSNQCPQCKKVFTMLSTLKDHMRVHSGERPFLCTYCGKGFTQNANLRQHVMRHTKVKKFSCPDCDNSYVTKAELHSHQRVHTGNKMYKCDTCEASFTTSSSLVKHKRKHTGERPYSCEFCPMLFATLNVLKNHRRTHTGEKPFKCSYCSKGFAQKGDCQIHERIHTGEKKYTCECGERFSRYSLARTHLRNHPECKEAIECRDVDSNMANIKTDDVKMTDDEEMDDHIIENHINES